MDSLRRRLRTQIENCPSQHELSSVDAAWAAGLFDGEGCCGVIRRDGRLYMNMSIQMLDRRSIERFAALFERKVRTWPLHDDRSRDVHRVDAAGRTAEAILYEMWPYLAGTAKGDQIRAAAEEVGVFGWIDGTAAKKRPARRGGNQWDGRAHTDEAKAKIAATQRARWERRRANGS